MKGKEKPRQRPPAPAGQIHLIYRMEAFNLLNRSNFLAPDINASNIRTVNGAPVLGGGYGRSLSSILDPRSSIPFVCLRLDFLQRISF
jgi:hypothetical protein